jgi:hypothetical protein
MANPKAPDADAVGTLSYFLGRESRAIDPEMRAYLVKGLWELKTPTPGLLAALTASAEDRGEAMSVRASAFKALFQLQPDEATRNSLFEIYSKDPEMSVLFAPPPQREPSLVRRDPGPLGGAFQRR